VFLRFFKKQGKVFEQGKKDKYLQSIVPKSELQNSTYILLPTKSVG